MNKPPYEKAALLNNVEQCLKNIEVFKLAILKEQDTIASLKGYIADIEEWTRSGNIV